MIKKILIVLGLILVISGILIWKNFKGALPVIMSSAVPTIPPTAQNSTGMDLKLPDGFSISTYAINLGSARDLAWDPNGTLLVSVMDQGRIVALPDENKDGKADKNVTVLFNLNKPHGIAFSANTLYVAETDKVVKYDYNAQTMKANNPQKILDLNSGGNHTSRSLLIKDNKLYIASGSTCNVCDEKNAQRAAVSISDLDGKNFRQYSTGLRNAPFIALNPKTNAIWVTEMGRDLLGDDIPPDEINILQDGKNYGWPICYGANIHDTDFDKKTYIQNPCNDKIPAHVELPAHSAPLGLAFIPDSWPKELAGKLIVSFHGSWNRTTPTGYKVVTIDPQTKHITDFVSGWLVSGTTASGRPVDVTFDSKGNLYISDDKAGNVYRVGIQ